MLHRISTKWAAPVFAALLIVGLVFTVSSVRSHSPASALPKNAAAAPSAQIVLASSLWNLTFSELTSITSKITPTVTTSGHSRPLGDPQPPKIVLERNLDPEGNQALYAWHQAARQGLPTAAMDVTLTVNESGGAVTYRLTNAWLSKLDISDLAAGSKQPATETVTILCEEIVVQ